MAGAFDRMVAATTRKPDEQDKRDEHTKQEPSAFERMVAATTRKPDNLAGGNPGQPSYPTHEDTARNNGGFVTNTAPQRSYADAKSELDSVNKQRSNLRMQRSILTDSRVAKKNSDKIVAIDKEIASLTEQARALDDEVKSLDKARPVYTKERAAELEKAATDAESAITGKYGDTFAADIQQRKTALDAAEKALEALYQQFEADPTEERANKFNVARDRYLADMNAYNTTIEDYQKLAGKYDSAMSDYKGYMENAKSDASGWTIAGDSFWRGLAQFDRGVAATLALPDKLMNATLFPGFRSPLSDLEDYYAGINDYWNDKVAASTYGKDDYVKLASEIGTGTVAAIPNAILAMMSGGASAGAQGATLASTANTGLAATVTNGLKDMAKNPAYWSSFLQTAGTDYEEAKADGASDMAAIVTAIISSGLNAGIEIGGGIETLPNELKNGGKGAIRAWVDSMIDEGKEEVLQDIVTGFTQKAVYDPGKTVFSMEDENAVIHPRTLAQDFGMGAAVGGILGGAQTGIVSAVNGGLNAKAKSDFIHESAGDFKAAGNDTVNAVIDEGLMSEPGTQARRVAEQLKAKQERGEAITQGDIARQYKANIKAVDAEAKAETNAQVKAEAMDYAKQYGYGEHGKAVLNEVIEQRQVNPDSVNQEFHLPYLKGMSNVDAAQMEFTSNLQREAFNAGRLDRIMSDKKAPRVTLWGKESGLIENEFSKNLDKQTGATIDQMGKALGVKIMFRDLAADNANGKYEKSKGVIYLDTNSKDPVLDVVKHEVTHRMQDLDPKAYNLFRDHAVQVSLEGTEYGNLSSVEEKVMQYARDSGGRVSLDVETAMDEIAAEYTKELFKDEQKLHDFIQEMNQTDEKRAAGKSFFDRVREFIQKVKALFKGDKAKMDDAVKEKFGADIDTIERAEKLWKDAYQAAAKNAAEMGQKNTAQADGVAADMFSLKGIREDGVEVYVTSDEVKNLPWAKRRELFLDLMKTEYAGRTAKFTRNGKSYYALFEEADVKKNIYGDGKSDRAGRDAKINTGADGAIFELVENAMYDGTKPESGKKNAAHKGVLSWDYFVKKVQIDNRVFDLLANVRKRTDGEYVYGIQLNEDKKTKAAPSRTIRGTDGLNGAQAASGASVAQTQDNVKFSMKDSTGKALTKEQAEFFKDSKAVDKDGHLLKLYHGTGTEFTVFDKGRVGENFGSISDLGFYFTPYKADAAGYASNSKNGVVMESYLNLKNPLIVEDDGWGSAAAQADARHGDLLRWAKDGGHDGIIVRSTDEVMEDGAADAVYIAFNSEQVKNTDNMTPTNDPDVRFSLKDDINQSMTMQQAKQMIQRAYVLGDVKNWSDGEYRNGDEWLRGAGAEDVAMVIDNEYSLQAAYLDKIKGILDGDFYTEDVLQAYLDGTLTGKVKQKAAKIGLDMAREVAVEDPRFYSPQAIKDAEAVYAVANQRMTKANQAEVTAARAKILLYAHNRGAASTIGLTTTELNKKLRSWSNYSSKAANLSARINQGMAKANRWTGIENMAYVNQARVTNDEIKRMVKSVEGKGDDFQNRYIARTMLALDTHIDWSWLNIKFDTSQGVNENQNTKSGRCNGYYSNNERLIHCIMNAPNTVAHEMGHALDYQWARDLGMGGALTEFSRTTERVSGDVKVWFDHFKEFTDTLVESSDIRSAYSGDIKETFARFVAKFVEWTEEIGTGRKSGYETSFYNDKFTGAQFVQFARLLQEKAALDVNGLTENKIGAEGAQFSLKGQNDLMRENAKLRETVAGLKEQFKTTEFAKVDKKAMDSFTKKLLRDYSSGADINETRTALDSLYTYIANGENGDGPVWSEAYKRAYEAAVGILEKSISVDDEMYKSYKGLRDRLRNTGMSISAEDAADIPGYDGLADFRRKNMGRIKISKDGVPVDVAYQELADSYPGLFKPDEFYHPGDQLAHISKVLDDMQPNEFNPYSYNIRESASMLANEIMERFFDLPQAKPTYADKAAAKLEATEAKGKRAVAKAIEERDAAKAKGDAALLGEKMAAGRDLSKQKARSNERIDKIRQEQKARVKELISENRQKVKDTIAKERGKRQAEVDELKATVRVLQAMVAKQNTGKLSDQEKANYRKSVLDGYSGTSDTAVRLAILSLEPKEREAVLSEYGKMAEEFGTIKKGEKPAREVQVPKKTAPGKNVSKTVRTILEAGATPDSAVPTIEQMVTEGYFSYDTYTDEQAISDANSTIERDGYETALTDWLSRMMRGEVSKKNTTMGWALYNQAATAGDVKTAMTILNGMVAHQRNAAQALQATRILKQMSPEMQLYQMQRSIADIQEELNDRYGEGKAPEIDVDEELAGEFMDAETQEERDEIAKKIYHDIGEQMPSRFIDKWNAWRYLAMLGNPRTHVRNVIGNLGFAPVVAAKDMTATAIESAVSRVSGGKLQRTKSAGSLTTKKGRALMSAAWADFDKVQDLMSGQKYNDAANQNQQIEEGKAIFKNSGAWGTKPGSNPLAKGVRRVTDMAWKPLEGFRKFNSNALEVEDMWFSKPHYAYAMAQYCLANNITPEQIANGKAIQPARMYAIKEAQKATYRDTNAFSQMVSEWGRSSGKKSKAQKVFSTVLEGILPFRKTPADILVRGVEYSPAGLLKGITYDLYQVKHGNMTGADAIDHISAGLTGTGLLALGLYLAAQGLIRGKGGDDDDKDEFERLMGHQKYSLELPGGTSVTLDWLAPEALPFFVGANLWELREEGKGNTTLSDILSSVASVTEPMLEMSCLQSLNDLFESVGYAASNDLDALSTVLASSATSYLTQAFPTILGQAERSSEPERMTTYTEKNAFLTSDLQYTLGKASARLPGWDFNQIPYIDAWGRKETNGSTLDRLTGNFLNPAFTSKIETSAMEKELLRLYEATGEAGVLPSRADKYFTEDKQRRDLTAEEYVRYATAKGQNSYKLVTDLVNSREYKALGDDEKARAVKDAYDMANQNAKASVSKYDPNKWVKAGNDTNAAALISFRSTLSSIRQENDGKLKDEDIIDVLDKMDLSSDETWALYLSENDSAGAKYANENGVGGDVYVDFKQSLVEHDEPTESGKFGTYTQDEAKAAIKALPGISDRDRAILWQSVNKSWKKENNPWRRYLPK